MPNLSDRQLSGIFFCVALAAALLAMIFSPLELDGASVAAAAVAIIVSLGGIYLATVSQRSGQFEEPEKPSSKDPSHEPPEHAGKS